VPHGAVKRQSIEGRMHILGFNEKFSQPTLGRHIADLREQLNVVLFERKGKGLTLHLQS